MTKNGVRLMDRLRSEIRRRLQSDPRKTLVQQLPKGGCGAEIGVHLGEFSRKLLDIAAPTELHLIDPWLYEDGAEYENALYGKKSGGQAEMDCRYESVRQAFEKQIASGTVKVHRSDSVSALSRFPAGYFDWVYIDGNHLYNFVLADLEVSYAAVRPGGWIAGDDYQHANWWGDGVIRAVGDFVQSKGITDRQIIGNQFLLRRPK